MYVYKVLRLKLRKKLKIIITGVAIAVDFFFLKKYVT